MNVDMSKSAVETAKLANFVPHIIPLVLDYLSSSSLAALHAIGDRRLSSLVMAKTKHLELQRNHNLPRIFPVDWFRSWTSLTTLELTFNHLHDHKFYENFDLTHLPSSLQRLELNVPHTLLLHYTMPFSPTNPLSHSSGTILPNLHELRLNISLRFNLIEENLKRDEEVVPFHHRLLSNLGPFLQNLPLSTLFNDSMAFGVDILSYLPPSITRLALMVKNGPVPSEKTLFFPPHLTWLDWSSELAWATIAPLLPPSLKILNVKSTSFDWRSVAHLQQLERLRAVRSSTLTPELARLLPRSLTLLGAITRGEPEFYEALPPSLKHLEGRQTLHRPSISLPPHLTHLSISTALPNSSWSQLPRTLTHIGDVISLSSDCLPYIPSLPPNLTSGIKILDVTDNILSALPCKQSIRELIFRGRNCEQISASALAPYASLRKLTIKCPFDLKLIRTLTCPLVHLVVDAKVSQLNDLVMPSSCDHTLETLLIKWLGPETMPEQNETSVSIHNMADRRADVLTPAWTLALPKSLWSLNLQDFIVSPHIFANISPSCIHLNFRVDANTFSFTDLRHLSSTVELVSMHVDGEMERPIKFTIDQLRTSLPTRLMDFYCHATDKSGVFELDEVVQDVEKSVLPLFAALPFVNVLDIGGIHSSTHLGLDKWVRQISKQIHRGKLTYD